ncbi:hypothetical protein [Streptomyces caatingaensis]|uniref:Uncharacterized protein n=1 Tax=Streptomyces caatingaensis TaxID=1678637 RepID=A0A0K9XIL2_9ACTN|nr:hypothetical protein [Streptomyces caatingaensis]KNB53219.1 hypothetical protein AC230_07160 [Streptomyces caatingaensis]
MEATRVTVAVEGRLGLDGPRRMRDELERATRLSWRCEEVDEGPALSGDLSHILLEAVIAKGAEMSLEYALEAVKRCVARWRAERLDDPPRARVDTSSVTGADAAGGTGPDGPGG